MHSLTPEYLDAIRLDERQAATLGTIREYRGKQTLYEKQTPEILNALKQTAIIESTESSNRLEGITAPREKIEKLVLKPAQPENRSEQEIAGYRHALSLIHDSAAHMPFSANVVLQLHGMMYRYLPGEGGHWKATDNEIIERSADGRVRVRSTPVSAVQTPQAMEDLVALYREAIDQRQREPLVVVPLAVFDFLCIHPFRDGNGRVGRLLTLLLLYHFEYNVGRFISLERVFEESKETYYETLGHCSARWHEGEHDPYPWMNYFWGVLIAAYKEFEERVGVVRKTGRGSKTDQIRAAVARRIGLFAISDIEAECPHVSRDMVRNVLRQLRDEGVIEAQGKGRSAKWLRRDL